MELSLSTLILEIINFLVLVWILQRFLYRPVLDVIGRRQQAIEDKLAKAKRLNDEAEALKEQYGTRLATWESERQAAREQLANEIGDERARRLEELDAKLEQERERREVAEKRRSEEERIAAQRKALQGAAAFSSRLLAEASGAELEARLVAMTLEALDGLSESALTKLRTQWGSDISSIEVASAFELSPAERGALEQRLTRICGASVPVRFRRDEALLAGLQIEIGAWVIAANVRDELKGFAELSLAAG